MKKYEITIEGTSPLLWNRMKRELLDEMSGLKKNELNEWEIDPKNWLRKAEIQQAGKYPKPTEDVMIPHDWLKKIIVEAFKHSKMVPHFATSKKETYTRYAGSFLVVSDTPLCQVKDLKEHAAYVSGQGKAGGGKVLKIRPKVDEWKHTFTLVDPFGRMEIEELKQAMEFGGYIEGIGDGRSVNFGRFETIQIKEAGA